MQDRDFQALLVEQEGHIVTLTFNKPEKKNPLSQELVNELLWALDDAEEDPEVRVIVLTGAGNAFSAGADTFTNRGVFAGRAELGAGADTFTLGTKVGRVYFRPEDPSAFASSLTSMSAPSAEDP